MPQDKIHTDTQEVSYDFINKKPPWSYRAHSNRRETAHVTRGALELRFRVVQSNVRCFLIQLIGRGMTIGAKALSW